MKKLICMLLILCCMTAGAEEMLAASGAHALYIDKSGAVWAWGSNHKGESNPESSEERVLTPVKVFDDASLCVACGRQFSARIDSEGTLSFWGLNAPESIENAAHVSACDEMCAWALKDGSGWVLSGGEAVKALDSGAVTTACGVDFAMFLTENGECWYYDGEARLIMSDVTAISASGQTAMLISGGEVYVMGGSGNEGRLGIDTTEWLSEPTKNGVSADIPVAGITCSGAITAEGQMYIWGVIYSYMTAFDENGDPMASLADGYLINYGRTPIQLYGGVKSAAFGEAFAMALMQDGTVLLWGSNDQGQCADGYYTACRAEIETDDDEGDTITIELEDNQQRIFPVSYTFN